MICILSISDRGGRFQVRYLERSPQPKVKEISLSGQCYRASDPRVRDVFAKDYYNCKPLWAEVAIANWLVKN